MPHIVSGMISTIIPVYNRKEMLFRSVQSVLAQTYRPIEIIISDDGSESETAKCADDLAKKYPGVIRVIHNSNRGPGPAREAGRQIANGEYIQYLDSDDQLHPRKFEVQVEALRQNPACGVAYGISRLVDEKGQVLKSPYKWTARETFELFPWLLVDRWWCTHTPLYLRSVCDAVGPWTDLRYSQDWEYDGRVGALGTRLVYCNEVVSDHTQHSGIRQTGSGKWLKPEDQVRFFSLMLAHARKSGLSGSVQEMEHFARWVFSAARKSGANGYGAEAEACFKIALSAASGEMPPPIDFRIYRTMAMIIGWKAAGRISQQLAKVRKRPGSSTMKLSWME